MNHHSSHAPCSIYSDVNSHGLPYFQIPAKLYDDCLKEVMATDSEALDQLLKRKCYEQG